LGDFRRSLCYMQTLGLKWAIILVYHHCVSI